MTGRRPTAWNGITSPRARPGGPRFLTDVIVELGLAPRERVEEAIESARASGGTPEDILVQAGALSQDALARAIAERNGLDHLDLTVMHVDMGAANLISSAAAKRYEAVPVQFIGDRGLLVAMADPANVLAVDDIALMTGYEVRPAVASREDISALVARLTRLDDVVQSASFEEEEESGAEVVELLDSAEDAPIIKLVNGIIAQAVEQGASDVHLSPDGHELRVRFRIDGVLIDSATVPRRMVSGVISRVKIMSDLDISERRVPQDGRVGITIDGHHVDLRVVSLPSVHGESIVMRILDQSEGIPELGKLGFADGERERFEKAFRQAYGAVLVTGPTGSGKSTSLYAALGEVNTPEKNIITIEDPVERQIEGITQVQVNARAGPDLRQRAARHDARRPRHHHGRGDPRPRDRADRHRGRAHRPPGPLHAAHQRRAGRHQPPHRDGHRALPRRQRPGLHRRPAPGADAVPALQAAHDPLGRGHARPRLPRAGRRRGL